MLDKPHVKELFQQEIHLAEYLMVALGKETSREVLI
jgi:hypothetical protein